MKQDYDTGKDDISMVTFKVDFDQAEKLEDTLKANCSRELKFYKHWDLTPNLNYTFHALFFWYMVDATSFEDVMMSVAQTGSVHTKVLPYVLPVD